MAVMTLPEGCYAQPNNIDSLDQSGINGFTDNIKGLYSDLETWMGTFVIGTDTFNGRVIRSRTLRRAPGDCGILTITTDYADSVVETIQQGYKGVWTFHAARNDKSILAYCGSAASRIHIEMWQKETDSTLADAYQFKDDNGTVHDLTNPEKLIAGKIAQGRESVIRFYPILTYTCYYKTCPKQWAVDIGLIRTPAAAAADKISAPDNISSVISGFVWLKVQDDIEEMPDGNYKRVMSWWGCSEGEGGWDEDFYGETRWSMPIE